MIVSNLPLLIFLDVIAWAIGVAVGAMIGLPAYRAKQEERQRQLGWIK